MNITSSNYSSLALLLSKIIEVYFSNHCFLIFSDQNINVMHTKPFIRLNSHNIYKNMLIASEIGCYDCIVQLQNPTKFLMKLDLVIQESVTRNGNRKIVLIDSNLELASLKPMQYIQNVIFITPNKETESCENYDILTRKFAGKLNNSNFEITDKWNGCEEKFEFGSNLFYNDMKDLEGMSLKLATFSYKPYVFSEPEYGVFDGTEIIVMKEFCRFVNCTIELVSDDDGGQWGEVYDNRTGNGIMGKVVTDDADMAIGALYMWYNEYKYLDFSLFIQRTGITCLAPAPKFVPSWMLPILPFNQKLWISIGVTFTLLVIALIIARRLGFFDGIGYTFSAVIAQPVPASIQSGRSRRILIWTFLLGLLISNLYSSGLVSTFTVPKLADSIDSVQDLVESDLDWGAEHDAWIYSILLSNETNILRLLSKFHLQPPEELTKNIYSGRFATPVERLPGGHYAIGDYIKADALPLLQLMQEDIYWEKTVVMARKSSPLTEPLNQLLGRLHSSGLLFAWEDQVALKYLDNDIQLAVKLSRSARRELSIVALRINKLTGVFFVLVLGSFLSIVVFLAEIISKQLKKKTME